MRITDALRGQNACLLDALGSWPAGRDPEPPLARLLREHRRALEPVLRGLERRLGPLGFLEVLRIDLDLLDHELESLGEREGTRRRRAPGAFGRHFAEHLHLVSLLLLPLADVHLGEKEIDELGSRWCADRGIPCFR